MAVTAEARTLTEAHRRAQLAIRAQALQDVLALWPMLDASALDRTFPAFSRAAEALIRARRSQSAGTAAAYYRAFREAEGAGAADLRAIIRSSPFPAEQVATSLRVTGPVAAKSAAARGLSTSAISAYALSQTAGAVVRLTLAGGRETLDTAVQRDTSALGWARVTGGRPCAFCAMLAGRGFVYKSEATAGGEYHDGCGCTTEPVFSRDSTLPGRGQEFRDLYREVADPGASSRDNVNAFRRAFERPELHLDL